MLLLWIAIEMPRRDQVVLDRATGRAELRNRQGWRYKTRWFDLANLEGFVANPPQEGFFARLGSLERVYVYIHVTGGMDAGFHLVSTATKSQTRTKRVVETANAWIAGKAV